jgi:histone H1/5
VNTTKLALPNGEKVKYKDLVFAAIYNIKDRTGSSLPAIEKYILSNKTNLNPIVFHSQLRIQLRRLAANGDLVKKKNSYLINNIVSTADFHTQGTIITM